MAEQIKIKGKSDYHAENQNIRKYGRKICRNELCPCGSGKKYKHCCYDKDKEAN